MLLIHSEFTEFRKSEARRQRLPHLDINILVSSLTHQQMVFSGAAASDWCSWLGSDHEANSSFNARSDYVIVIATRRDGKLARKGEIFLTRER